MRNNGQKDFMQKLKYFCKALQQLIIIWISRIDCTDHSGCFSGLSQAPLSDTKLCDVISRKYEHFTEAFSGTISQVTVQKSAYQNVDQYDGYTNFFEQHNNSNSNINIHQNLQQFKK